MTPCGHNPENPVCVASAIVLDHTQNHVLLGARLQTQNEGRHLNTFSTFTRGTTRALFNLLTGGNPADWEPGIREISDSKQEVFWIGHGKHSENIDAFVVESVLAKAGLAEKLIDGSIRGYGLPAIHSLAEVPDKDTGQTEFTAMKSYTIVLDENIDYDQIPVRSAAYDPIKWFERDSILEAIAQNNVGHLRLQGGLELSGRQVLDLCVGGLCVRSAVPVLSGSGNTQVQ